MSMSPQAGAEEGWPGQVLQRGVALKRALDESDFALWFARATTVTRRTQGFHVALPACDSNYLVAFRGNVLGVVQAWCTSSIEVPDAQSLVARRWDVFLYTTLLSTGAQRPPWAEGVRFQTPWWADGIRGTFQPLQDAILESGRRDTCVYMARLQVPRCELWVAIWRVRSLYSYRMLRERTLYRSGAEAVSALKSDLQQLMPGLCLAGTYTFLGLNANPEPAFPKTARANPEALQGNPPAVTRSPLTIIPRFFDAAQHKIRCTPEQRVSVRYAEQVSVLVPLPPAVVDTSDVWSFVLEADNVPNFYHGRAEWCGPALQCGVPTEAWAQLCEQTERRTRHPWFDLRLEANTGGGSSLPVPQHLKWDIRSGRGYHCRPQVLLRPCLLLDRAEYLDLDEQSAVGSVLAVVVYDDADALRKVSAVRGSIRRRVCTQSRLKQVERSTAAIVAETTAQGVLEQFGAAEAPTRKHVSAVLGRMASFPVSSGGLHGKSWSRFLASCARRMHRLEPRDISRLVEVLCRHARSADSGGDNDELLDVVSALRQRGCADEAGMIERAHGYGRLGYLVLGDGVPPPVAKRLRHRRLHANYATAMLKLAASDEGEGVYCPKWKAEIKSRPYSMSSGRTILETARSKRAEAVERAIPSQRKRLAAELKVLAIESRAVWLRQGSATGYGTGPPTEVWEVAPQLAQGK